VGNPGSFLRFYRLSFLGFLWSCWRLRALGFAAVLRFARARVRGEMESVCKALMGCSILLAQVDSGGAGACTRMIRLCGISGQKCGVLVVNWCHGSIFYQCCWSCRPRQLLCKCGHVELRQGSFFFMRILKFFAIGL
jgi:hypothetical protein